jgi:uncharacterized membrane protein YcjF (UPF0283 family)
MLQAFMILFGFGLVSIGVGQLVGLSGQAFDWHTFFQGYIGVVLILAGAAIVIAQFFDLTSKDWED